jgi:ribonuclease P protein component
LLPKEARIRRGDEIRKILSKKQYRFTTPLLFFTGQINKNGNRFLTICSKKLGTAVLRNRIRRQLSGWYLNNRRKIAKNIDMIVSPRQPDDGQEYIKQLENGLTKQGLL